MIFGAVMLALYASFRAAQKREAKLLEELESDN